LSKVDAWSIQAALVVNAKAPEQGEDQGDKRHANQDAGPDVKQNIRHSKELKHNKIMNK
jgi:hypothetical protein